METYLVNLERDLKVKGLSESTQYAYMNHVKHFLKHYEGRHPIELDLNDIRQYQLHLLKDRKFEPGTVNVRSIALRFFYGTTLNRDWVNKIHVMKKKHRVPMVLTPEEVVLVLNSVQKIKFRAILTTMYATGLRISEAMRLKPEDIDSKAMRILVRNGKGNKSRYTILPEPLLLFLRKYWVEDKSIKTYWLFPGSNPHQPITGTTVRRFFRYAVRDSGIKKPIVTHTLRHSFATHLMEEGAHFRHIQVLLGHASMRSTTIYTHVLSNKLLEVKSPLEVIAELLK